MTIVRRPILKRKEKKNEKKKKQKEKNKRKGLEKELSIACFRAFEILDFLQKGLTIWKMN